LRRGGPHAPLCSSIGRLFDAVASLLGLIQICSFEGQAALRLEAAAWEGMRATAFERAGPYTLPIGPASETTGSGQSELPLQINWQPLLIALLADRDRGVPVPAIALAFHQALAGLLVALAETFSDTPGERRLLLAGGCFQNRLLLQLAATALQQAGIEALWPQRIPCNDGGLALGQLLAAAQFL